MKRGDQKQIETPGQQERCHAFCAWDWHRHEIVWQMHEAKNTASFCQFIEYLLVELYPNDRIVLIMDNASFHHSRQSRATLSLFEERVLLYWLPPYCSVELNPIERYFKHLKHQVCVNVLYPSLAQLVASVQAELERQNDANYSERFLFLKQELKVT